MWDEFPGFARVEPPRDVLVPHLQAMGDAWEEHHFQQYWADYCGVARHFKPRGILEVGVRFGYTAFCLAWGSPCFELYLGLDNESYQADSCRVARDWLAQRGLPGPCMVQFCDTQQGLPVEAIFDLVHVDGDHSALGALNDLVLCWPKLRPGGVLILDDYWTPEVAEAARRFMSLVKSQISAVGRSDNVQGHLYLLKG